MNETDTDGYYIVLDTEKYGKRRKITLYEWMVSYKWTC